ncbi:MAG TPA: hypothetical protein VF144_21425 [Chitinophagaceae bacterium]
MSREQIDTLFNRYETAFDKLDMKAMSGYCADSFITASPKGSSAQSRIEYEQKADETIEFYKSAGRNSAKIISKRVIPISNEYSMVVVRWGITFEKTGERLVEFDKSYIIQETGIDPKIILFISHDDEVAAMKKLGVLSGTPG